jgi:hypothetical protein
MKEDIDKFYKEMKSFEDAIGKAMNWRPHPTLHIEELDHEYEIPNVSGRTVRFHLLTIPELIAYNFYLIVKVEAKEKPEGAAEIPYRHSALIPKPNQYLKDNSIVDLPLNPANPTTVLRDQILKVGLLQKAPNLKFITGILTYEIIE